MTVEITCPDAVATMAAGRRLAGLLWAGDVVLLDGDLGAGKTTFVAGLAEGLGVDEAITSPTFILMRTYPGLMSLTHADVYRIETLAELEDLDLIEASAEGVLAVEWGTAIEQWVPADHLVVRIRVQDSDTRKIEFLPRGSWATRPLAELQA